MPKKKARWKRNIWSIPSISSEESVIDKLRDISEAVTPSILQIRIHGAAYGGQGVLCPRTRVAIKKYAD